MKKNPLIPFALIAFIGIVMMVILSYQGLHKADQLAKEKDKPKATASAKPEDIVNGSCTSCHGGNLEGGMGPKLSDVGSRLNADQIKDVLMNGKGSGMPAGLVPADQVDKVAKWLAEKK
ncbi:MAG: cytochrome c550 [Bacillaceae bacterium]